MTVGGVAQAGTAHLPGFDNRRRTFIIASFFAVTTILAALGLFPWQPPVILLAWLGVILATGRLVERQTSVRSVLRVATAGFCADTAFISACAFFVGGALWITTAFYLFLIMVAASMLPLRQTLVVASCAVTAFTVLVFAEVTGAIERPPFFNLPEYVGNYQLGLTTVAVAAATFMLAVLVQQSLVGAIRRSEESHGLVLEAASEMIATLDEGGRVLRVNDSMLAHTGLSRDRLLGGNVADLMAPEFRPPFERQLQLVRLGSRVPVEGSFVHADGSERWLSGTVTPVPNRESSSRMLLVARDVTSEKIAAAERETLRNELAQALRMQALGRLISGVAHELGNPLTAILTTTDDMLDGSELTPDDGESLRMIRQQAHRARATVRDLVAFVKTGSERKRERILPSAALTETLAAMRTQVGVAGVTLQTSIAPNMEPIEVDRAGFDQVITNIVMNAAQAAGAGGIVAVQARVADGACEIVVEDNGAGIASEALDHIFEPFYTTKAVGKGAGLGLSLALGIIEYYGGTVAVRNRSFAEEGSSGARFTVRVPVAEVGDVKVAPVSAAARGHAVDGRSVHVPAEKQPRVVLVIDDEAPVRRALRRYLERFGWPVEELPSAVEALPVLLSPEAAERYAVIICDIKMPELSGIELCRRLKEHAPALLDRFVLTSGNVAQYADEIRDCSPRGTLAKPYDVAQLRALVDEIATAPAPG